MPQCEDLKMTGKGFLQQVSRPKKQFRTVYYNTNTWIHK